MLSTIRMNSAAVSMQYMTTNDVEGQQAWLRAVYLCREGRCQSEPDDDVFEIGSVRQCGTSRGRSFGDGMVRRGHGLVAACERTVLKERSRSWWAESPTVLVTAVGLPGFCRGPELGL